MAISKDRLEKELAAQKYRAAKIEGEVLAQKRKAEAIAHLESQGQRVQGVEGFTKVVAAKTADNTLALLLGRKAITTATEGEKIKEQLAKAALIRQQDESRRNREMKADKIELPPNWESVFDDQSKLFYYWNRITNITTWEKPEPSEVDDLTTIPSKVEISPAATVGEGAIQSNSLLPGWEEKTHSATQQSYYINTISGEVRSVKPTLETLNAQSTGSKILETNASGNKMRHSTSSSSSGEHSKFQRHSIDPLDFEALQGYANRGKTTDKMADSTASGPLWQQRPYPAPGTIMRLKEASSEPAVGPSFRGPSHGSQPPSSSSRAGPVKQRAPFVKGSTANKGHSNARSAPGHYGPSR